MSNKALAFLIFIGLALVVALILLFVLAQKRKEASGQLEAEVLQLRQQNAIIAMENLGLKMRDGNEWGGQ